MDIWGIIGILFIGFIFYSVLSGGPPSTLVYSSGSELNVKKVKSYLEGKGIKVYIKGQEMRRYHKPGLAYSDLVNLTLHVVDSKDRKRALELLRDAKRNQYLDLA